MSAIKVAPPQPLQSPAPQATRALTDDPSIEAQPVRGLVYGLLLAAAFWLLFALLAINTFHP